MRRSRTGLALVATISVLLAASGGCSDDDEPTANGSPDTSLGGSTAASTTPIEPTTTDPTGSASSPAEPVPPSTSPTTTQPGSGRDYRLDPGEQLAVGGVLTSPNGQFQLVMQADGNLVLYGPGGALWSAGGGPGAVAVMQADGNLVVYSSDQSPAWNSRTYGNSGATLVVQDDGKLVIYATDGVPLWDSAKEDRLDPGEQLAVGGVLTSPNGQFQLVMQADGNLVLYGPGGALWSAGGGPGAVAVMQADGNFVIYTPGHIAAWSSRTGGNPGAALVLQDDSNAVIYSSAATALWALDFQSVRLVARLLYSDSNGPRPIQYTRVQIWAGEPWSAWRVERELETNGDGRIDELLPFHSRYTTYALRVFSQNSAAIVAGPGLRGSWDPGYPGPDMHLVSAGPGAVLDFSFMFGADAAAAFNIAEVVRLSRDYARSLLPSDSEVLRQMHVAVGGNITFYNPLVDAFDISPEYFMDDATILHEYAHFIEEQTSSFAWIPASHDGCNFELPEHAWMEGFADWYSQAATDVINAGLTGSRLPLLEYASSQSGTLTKGALESPFCPASSVTKGRWHHEMYVAAVLWDLFDPYNASEPWDTASGNDKLILEVLDNELDTYGKWPTIRDFGAAAIGRGFSEPVLQAILQGNGL